ncbi:MAG: dockerin type I repeat-containing protein, partial [Acutalibacteraceae bacterium]
CDGLISTFKANTEYKYCLYIKLTEEGYNAGYRFGKNTALSVNGKAIDLNPDYVSISEDGGLAQFGYVLTMTPVEEPSFVIGDVNMDGKVNLVDAILVQKNSLGMDVFTEEQLALGDVNKDGYISLIDGIMIQKYALGMITSF